MCVHLLIMQLLESLGLGMSLDFKFQLAFCVWHLKGGSHGNCAHFSQLYIFLGPTRYYLYLKFILL